MYSPTKDSINKEVRMRDNKKRYIVKGRRNIKKNLDDKVYKPVSISK